MTNFCWFESDAHLLGLLCPTISTFSPFIAFGKAAAEAAAADELACPLGPLGSA